MSSREQQIFSQLDEIREAWSGLLSQLGEGLPLNSLFESAKSDEAVGQCRLLKCLDSMPGARKVDNRRFMSGHGIDERIRLVDMSDSQIDLVLEAYDV